MSNTEPLLISIDQTKAAIGLGRTTIYELIHEGKLEVVKIKGRTMVKYSSIQRLIADACAAAA